MTDQDRLSHLLRRFGLGAGTAELATYSPLGVEGTLNRLLDAQNQDEGFPISPWEVTFEKGKDEAYVDPDRYAAWWSLRLLLSQRPLEQRMTVLWHSHLVAAADKVEFGPAMVEYLETLRSRGLGDYRTLLASVSLSPAMLRYLDGDTSVVGNPNENFGREVMELFTLGVGNYTEADVKNVSRALTGWGLRFLAFEGGADAVQPRIKKALQTNGPMVATSYSPALHDDTAKTILGETKNFSTDDVFTLLAARPETAKRISSLLYSRLAHPEPSSAVVDHLAGIYTSSGGQIKSLLKEIATMDEFWSPTSVRSIVKSPVDFVIPIVRQMNVRAFLLGMHTDATPTTPLADGLRGTAGLLYGMMTFQGMQLFYPPNVSGWTWGEAWISSNNMGERMKFAATIFGMTQPDKGLANWVGQQILATKPADDATMLEHFLAMFDADVFSLEKKKLLLQAAQKAGGLAAIGKPEGASLVLGSVARLVFGAPEFQFC